MPKQREIESAEREALSHYSTETAAEYRIADEEMMETDAVQRICTVLTELTVSFDRSVDILDLACGSGRYFHALRQVRRLVGVDLSQAMIDVAHNPVRANEIEAKSIELICASMFDVELAPNSFDFAYAIGVFGDYVPFTSTLCSRLYAALRSDSRLFFTIVSRETDLLASRDWKRSLVNQLRLILPISLNKYIYPNSRHYIHRTTLETILAESQFDEYTITRHVSRPPNPHLVYYEVHAIKEPRRQHARELSHVAPASFMAPA